MSETSLGQRRGEADSTSESSLIPAKKMDNLLDPTLMLVFDRLPTPGPSRLSFISPPVSRASSVNGDDPTPEPSSKTHSFFSNPFSSKPSVPNLRPPPRLAPTTANVRSVSDSSPRAATDSFFSSASVSPRPTPPPSIHSHSRNSSEGDTPKPLLPPNLPFLPFKRSKSSRSSPSDRRRPSLSSNAQQCITIF